MSKLEIKLGEPVLVVTKPDKTIILESTFSTYEELDEYMVLMINENKFILKHKEFAYLDVFSNENLVFYLTKNIS